MKKIILLFGFLSIFFFTLNAQVTFIIESLPEYTPPEDILYIAGDFQGWNPGDPNFALQKNSDDKWFIELESMPNGTLIKFKFTRGDWGKVEKGVNGEEIPDRQFTYGNGETVEIIIYNWADNSGGNTTAAENVSIMDDDFYMPQLNRNRRIWLYLPPDYDLTTKNYPVIYMHDGQNLFDTYTSFAGEWEVDETLNELYDSGHSVPIVVGIDNGGTERINEYTPWVNSQYGGGMGSLYIDFIVETLKPYIDENFRTLPEREYTALWGSSLGGLISHYGVLKYQDIFSKAGIYSPSYWFSDSVWTFTQQMGHQQEMRLYQMTGSLESGSMVQDTWAMHDTLSNLGFSGTELSTKIVQGGQHNEQLWKGDFEEAYLWLFDTYANNVRTYISSRTFLVTPNPVTDHLLLPEDMNGHNIRVKIYDINGRIRINAIAENENSIRVVGLNAGIYLIEIIADETLWWGKFIKQ